MSHYIRIFLLFVSVNYLLVFIYDNYYLVSVEENYLIDSRDELRKLALELRTELVKATEDKEIRISEFALRNNIPSRIILKFESELSRETVRLIEDSDYNIELYSDYGPVVYLNLDDSRVVEIGPLDPLIMSSTTYQPLFIILMLLCNAITAYVCFRLFRTKVEKVEKFVEGILERRQVSPEVIGEQDALRKTTSHMLELDNYIQEIEETNHRVVDDQRDLMHAVAHELRSPIARMSFALELVEDEDTSPENKKLLKEMHDSIDELESLIKEILGYSRLSHGKMELNLEQVEVLSLVKNLSGRLQLLYPREAIEIKSEVSSIEIEADPRLLERALVNLLRNAARFAKKNVEVEIKSSDSQLSIAIDDDGMGIPPGKRERIFEAFTRLDPSRSRDSGGVGLGLAIVKKIVEMHQGDISVSDSLLGGARFVLKIPFKTNSESLES